MSKYEFSVNIPNTSQLVEWTSTTSRPRSSWERNDFLFDQRSDHLCLMPINNVVPDLATLANISMEPHAQLVQGLRCPRAWIAADILPIEDGKVAEHWDVLQDEVTQAESVSGLPMFGNTFPSS